MVWTLDSSREMAVGEVKDYEKANHVYLLHLRLGVKNSKLWMSNQRHVMADFMASYLQVLTVPSLCVLGDCGKSRRAKCNKALGPSFKALLARSPPIGARVLRCMHSLWPPLE